MRSHRGFTIIELLVTMAMFGIFASIALPSFAGLLGRQQLNQAASQIENAVLRGRTLAVAKNQAVNLNITLPAAGQSVTYKIVTANTAQTVLSSDTLPSQVTVSYANGAGTTLTSGTAQIQFNARGVITAPAITATAIPTATLTQNQNTRQVRLLSVLGKIKVVTP